MTYVMTAEEKALREKRANIWEGMQATLEESRKNGWTVERRADFDARDAELTTLEGDIGRIVKANEYNRGVEQGAETRGVSVDQSLSEDEKYVRAYEDWFKHGMAEASAEHRQMVMERRDNPLGTDAGTGQGQAGYLIPQGFWHNLQQAMKAYGGLLQYTNIITTDTGNSLPWPTNDSTAIVGSYLTENTAMGNQDYSFGQGMLHAWTIVSNVALASVQILNDSAFSVDAFVSERMGESIGRKIAQELHTGSGVNAMLGLQTALTARGTSGVGLGGIYQGTSGEVVNTLNSYANPPTQHALAAGVPSFSDVLAMREFVDPAYRAAGQCRFVFSSGTLSKLRSICDGFGRPLWNPSVQVNEHDNLYGDPYFIDQNVGEIGTVANTVGSLMYGDFSRAMVVRQVRNAGSMRLTERYAEFLQVGYLSYVRMDARSNDLRAAVIYKTPAA